MTIQLLAGDCRDVLPTLAADSVHCVVCSPPYWNLRDYQTGTWDGGDADCQHTVARNDTRLMLGSNGTLGKNCTSWTHRDATPPRQCSCGAVRIDRQIGLEASPSEYLATMVAVFREIRRVLRPDGTCWVNLGDSFSGGNNVGWRPGNPAKNGGNSNRDGCGAVPGLAAKQLLLMPARLALALQADGWWVRSDIIWHKPNPMPESCTDRPTSAHEHVFLLTRSSRYYYDADAVREAHNEPWRSGNDEHARERPEESLESGRPRSFGWQKREYHPAGRNLRNVWTIATSPFSAAHFATFPPELAERCIRAGTSERGCCAACGAPWRRTQEVVRPSSWEARKAAGHPMSGYHAADGAIASRQQVDDNAAGGLGWVAEKRTTGWQPGCDHGAEVVPCTVLDPFFGAGTTGLVAERLQRDCIGIDLNPDYNAMSRARIEADAPLFTSFPPAEDPEETRMADLFAEAAE